MGGGGDEREIFLNPEDGLHLNEVEEDDDGGGVEDRLRMMMRILVEGLGDGAGQELLEELNLEELLKDGEELPTTLIVTGLSQEFFESSNLKSTFQSLFNIGGEQPAFHYFPSFKRVRISYQTPAVAIIARVKLDGSWLDDENQLKCFFGATPLVGKTSKKCEDGLLHPPTPDKQFLISPPASPPVGWEPHPEYAPTINFDLLAAISKLSPGETCELFKSDCEKHPSIVVHIAGADTDDPNHGQGLLTEPLSQQIKPKIVQTKRPS